MQRDNSLIAEMKRRLEHLRTMPETPMRTREIMGLERALKQAEEQNVQKTRTGKVVRARRKTGSVRDDEPIEELPRRRVEHKDGKRRVRIRTGENKFEGDNGDKAGVDSRKKTMNDIRSMIGLSHRGMS